MKTLNYVKSAIVFISILAFASCGDTYHTDDFLRNSNEKLCANLWTDRYTQDNGNIITHSLEFMKDGRGREIMLTVYSDGRSIEVRDNFSWQWIDNTMEGLSLDYVSQTSYFHNVWIREHYLTGTLDGEHRTFADRLYNR